MCSLIIKFERVVYIIAMQVQEKHKVNVKHKASDQHFAL